jgi:hypothetical protein
MIDLLIFGLILLVSYLIALRGTVPKKEENDQ